MKKFMAMIMTLAMVLALAVPAFAASAGSAGSHTYGGEIITPRISVDCWYGGYDLADTAVKLYLNPYGLKATDATAPSTATKIYSENETQQIISAPLVFESSSNCPIAISVKKQKATPTDTTNMKIVKAAPTKATTTLDAYLYLIGETATDMTKNGKYPGDYNADNSVVLTDQEATKITKLVTIPAPGTTHTFGQIGIGGALQTEHAMDTSGNTQTWVSGKTISVTYEVVISPAVATA